jgi:hypothetical protein
MPPSGADARLVPLVTDQASRFVARTFIVVTRAEYHSTNVFRSCILVYVDGKSIVLSHLQCSGNASATSRCLPGQWGPSVKTEIQVKWAKVMQKLCKSEVVNIDQAWLKAHSGVNAIHPTHCDTSRDFCMRQHFPSQQNSHMRHMWHQARHCSCAVTLTHRVRVVVKAAGWVHPTDIRKIRVWLRPTWHLLILLIAH